MIVSLAIRLGAALFLTGGLDFGPVGDEEVFTGIAWNLVSGNGYSMYEEPHTALRPPAYPFLLTAVFSIFGRSLVAARIINILISSLTVGAIYLLSCRLFGSGIGLIAGLMSAGNPFFIVWSAVVYSDVFYLFLLVVILLLFIKIHETDGLKVKLACGAVLGVAILTRSELFLFIPFILIWAFLFYRSFNKAVRTSVVILLPVLLLVLPWLVRNYIVFDSFVMSTNFGQVFWYTHNPITFSDSTVMGGCLNVVPGGPGLKGFKIDSNPEYDYFLPEREWNQVHINLALESIKQNIKRLPRMEIYKLRNLVSSGGAVESLLILPFVYCFFFGLFLLLVSGDKRLLIFYMLMLFLVFIALIFYTGGRMRMPAEMMIIIIGSYGLSEQVKLIKQKRGSRETSTRR